MLDILNKNGVNSLAAACVNAGMTKPEILEKYRNAVMEYETRNGREVASYYVLGDAVDAALNRQWARDRSSVQIAYFKARKAGHRASQAILIAKDSVAFEAWKDLTGERNFYTGAQFWHDGLRYTFKIESDDDNFRYSDIVDNKRKLNAMGYYCESVRHGAGDDDNKRYSGQGAIEFIHDVNFDRDVSHFHVRLPRSFFEQYHNKTLAKHAAYTGMVQDAIASVKAELDSLADNYCYASITVENEAGEEVASESLGGCDSDYCTSGRVFYEQLWDSVQSSIAKHKEAVACEIAASIAESRPDLMGAY